jgi:hypothetical protein
VKINEKLKEPSPTVVRKLRFGEEIQYLPRGCIFFLEI